MTDTVFDTKKRVEELEKELTKQKLLDQASIEAIQYAIDLALLDSDDSMSFLQAWSEGEWQYIVDMFPNFDINSEAQQALIKESGGMPT